MPVMRVHKKENRHCLQRPKTKTAGRGRRSAGENQPGSRGGLRPPTAEGISSSSAQSLAKSRPPGSWVQPFRSPIPTFEGSPLVTASDESGDPSSETGWKRFRTSAFGFYSNRKRRPRATGEDLASLWMGVASVMAFMSNKIGLTRLTSDQGELRGPSPLPAARRAAGRGEELFLGLRRVPKAPASALKTRGGGPTA